VQNIFNLSLYILNHPLSLSQTYIGAKAVQILVENFRAVHNPRPILCVCYTNHALDQFLMSLLDVGIDSIVRIGGGCKTGRLEEYNLRKCTLIGKSNEKKLRLSSFLLTHTLPTFSQCGRKRSTGISSDCTSRFEIASRRSAQSYKLVARSYNRIVYHFRRSDLCCLGHFKNLSSAGSLIRTASRPLFFRASQRRSAGRCGSTATSL